MKRHFPPTAAGRPRKPSTRRGKPTRKGRAFAQAGTAWIAAASRLPGKSLHVGIALWLGAETTGSHIVPLGNLHAKSFGLNRNAKYRALLWLENAGLVSVNRQLGRAPLVTILDAEGDHDRIL